MNHTLWKVRKAVPDDAPALVQLANRVYGETYCVPRALSPQCLADDIHRNQVQLFVGEVSNTIVAQGGVIARGHGVQEVTRLMLDRQWLLQQRLPCRGLTDEITFEILFKEPLRLKTKLLFATTVALREEAQLLSLRDALVPLGITFATYPSWQVQGGPAIDESVPVVVFGRWDADKARPRQLHLSGAWLKVAKLALNGLKLPTMCVESSTNQFILENLGWRLDHCSLIDRITCVLSPNGIALATALIQSQQRAPTSIMVNIPAEAKWASCICQYLETQNFIPGAYLPMGGADGEDILQAQLRPNIPSLSMQMRLVPQAWPFLEAMVSEPERFAVQTQKQWRPRKNRKDAINQDRLISG